MEHRKWVEVLDFIKADRPNKLNAAKEFNQKGSKLKALESIITIWLYDHVRGLPTLGLAVTRMTQGIYGIAMPMPLPPQLLLRIAVALNSSG